MQVKSPSFGNVPTMPTADQTMEAHKGNTRFGSAEGLVADALATKASEAMLHLKEASPWLAGGFVAHSGIQTLASIFRSLHAERAATALEKLTSQVGSVVGRAATPETEQLLAEAQQLGKAAGNELNRQV